MTVRAVPMHEVTTKDAHRMFAVLDPTGLLVAYESWCDWREDRRRDATTEPLPLVAAGTSFCAHCWGQGRVYAPARNGEGLVPAPCPVCDASGAVR